MANIAPHKWYKLRSIPWPICSGCGLLALKNELTRWCIKHGCDHAELPNYKTIVKELSRQ